MFFTWTFAFQFISSGEMETRGTKEMGKTKLSCKVKEKTSITSYYLLLSDENIYVIGEEESSSGNRSSGLVKVGGLLGL